MGRHSRIEDDGMTEILEPIATSGSQATWDGATWIGQVDQLDLVGERLQIGGGAKFRRARLLVWTGYQPRGFIEVPVQDGYIDVATAYAKVAQLPYVEISWKDHDLPPISVVVCTRDRPDQLRRVLANLSHLDYPSFEVVVVDNNPASGLTPQALELFDSLPITTIDVPGQGLSIARNAGIKKARYDIVAFTDDDVVVDERWLRNLARGFARGDRVACVSGLVPSAELNTPAQSYFDRRVGWAQGFQPAVYDLAAPPADDALFPLHVALYGTGANFAVRRGVVIEVGGFDEALGVGAPAAGGEDIDMFVRILLAGHVLVREPSAVIWHHHRQTQRELVAQIDNYGLGLGAWIYKLLTRPKTFGMVVRRLSPALRHLRGVTVVDHDESTTADETAEALEGRELKGVRRGPLALIRGRIAGRQAAPLKPAPAKVLRAFDFRRDQLWGDPGNSLAAGRLAVAAFALGLLGALGTVRVLPSPLLVILVAAFVFGGPGALVMSWYPHLSTSAIAALVPTIGAALCVMVVTGLLMAGFYNPPVILLGLSLATSFGGLLRCVYLAQRQKVTS